MTFFLMTLQMMFKKIANFKMTNNEWASKN